MFPWLLFWCDLCCLFWHWHYLCFHKNNVPFTPTLFTSLFFLFYSSSYFLSVSLFVFFIVCIYIWFYKYFGIGSYIFIMALVCYHIIILVILVLIAFHFWYFTSHCRDDNMETLTVDTPLEVTAVIIWWWLPVMMNHWAG